jgi:hypothetical protein
MEELLDNFHYDHAGWNAVVGLLLLIASFLIEIARRLDR